jgi:F-type H+-transporting ATPase subunit c
VTLLHSPLGESDFVPRQSSIPSIPATHNQPIKGHCFKNWISNFIQMLEGAKLIGAGCATIALAGAAVGIGNVFSSLITSVARNPSLAKQLFGYAILGFALTEAIALFALMMAFLILFVF